MGETFEFNRSGKPASAGAAMAASDVKHWFVREVLPLEAMLMHFLHQNWRNKAEIEISARMSTRKSSKPQKTKSPRNQKPFS